MSEPGADAKTVAGRLTRLWSAVSANDWSRIVAAAVVVGGVLAVSGGFGTDALMIGPRFAYWMALFLTGAGLGRLAASRLIPRVWFVDRRWLAMVAVAALVGAPMCLIVAAGSAAMLHRVLGWRTVWEVAPSTLGVTLGMTALAFLVQPRGPAGVQRVTTADTPRFLGRLPGKLSGATLWAVEAEDHYLRLHTSKGQDLILMRLADALAELEGLDGARVHRSWWVAREAVRGVTRLDGRAILTLPGGLEAPVSRAYLKPLREAGWF